MTSDIKALFKQATVKGGMAVLTFEVLTDEPDAFELVKQSGRNVFLSVVPEQQEIVYVNDEGEVL